MKYLYTCQSYIYITLFHWTTLFFFSTFFFWNFKIQTPTAALGRMTEEEYDMYYDDEDEGEDEGEGEKSDKSANVNSSRHRLSSGYGHVSPLLYSSPGQRRFRYETFCFHLEVHWNSFFFSFFCFFLI